MQPDHEPPNTRDLEGIDAQRDDAPKPPIICVLPANGSVISISSLGSDFVKAQDRTADICRLTVDDIKELRSRLDDNLGREPVVHVAGRFGPRFHEFFTAEPSP